MCFVGTHGQPLCDFGCHIPSLCISAVAWLHTRQWPAGIALVERGTFQLRRYHGMLTRLLADYGPWCTDSRPMHRTQYGDILDLRPRLCCKYGSLRISDIIDHWRHGLVIHDSHRIDSDEEDHARSRRRLPMGSLEDELVRLAGSGSRPISQSHRSCVPVYQCPFLVLPILPTGHSLDAQLERTFFGGDMSDRRRLLVLRRTQGLPRSRA